MKPYMRKGEGRKYEGQFLDYLRIRPVQAEGLEAH
jgi:hypothetical protein